MKKACSSLSMKNNPQNTRQPNSSTVKPLRLCPPRQHPTPSLHLHRITKTIPAHAPALHLIAALSRPPVTGPMQPTSHNRSDPPLVQRQPQSPTQRHAGRWRLVGTEYLPGRPDRTAWHERLFYGYLYLFGFQLHRYRAGRLPGDQRPFAKCRH